MLLYWSGRSSRDSYCCPMSKRDSNKLNYNNESVSMHLGFTSKLISKFEHTNCDFCSLSTERLITPLSFLLLHFKIHYPPSFYHFQGHTLPAISTRELKSHTLLQLYRLGSSAQKFILVI